MALTGDEKIEVMTHLLARLRDGSSRYDAPSLRVIHILANDFGDIEDHPTEEGLQAVLGKAKK